MGYSCALDSTESTPPTRTALYRHFDVEGRLLYVGISLNAVARLAQHRETAHWFGQIARIEVEWHESRMLAEAAERKAIKAERPAHNLAHAGMSESLRQMLVRIGKLHMVDERGKLKPEHNSLAPGEAEAIAARWDSEGIKSTAEVG